MPKEHLNAKIFDSRIRSGKVTLPERLLGFFLGPVSVLLMNSILNNYLNVYYTDVVHLGDVWNGWFLTSFPIVVKLIDALTYILMGRIMSRFYSRQGVARPWILLSAPLLCISMVLLFAVPAAKPAVVAIWVFLSYNLFYSIAYTAYNSAHTLMVPLATSDREERSKLSVFTNMQTMLSGALVAVLFPTLIVPRLGVNKVSWVTLMTVIAAVALPLISFEYFFTRERVTEENRRRSAEEEKPASKLSMMEQFRLCLKSRQWAILMVYLILSHLASLISSFATFYYCNWVLGSYNDGITQFLYYAVGNGLLGPGLFLARPICKKIGRRNAMAAGFILAAVGTLLCFLNPTNLVMVLIGQGIKSIGLIPSTYMVTAMLGDALDDVRDKTGERCDGFSSAAFNVIMTVTTGLAMAALNFGITRLGYVAPTEGAAIPTQPALIKNFFTFCAVGAQTFVFPVVAAVLMLAPNDKKEKAHEQGK